MHEVPKVVTGTRPASRAQKMSGGGYVEWPASARPSIQGKHIDGPMIVFRNGEVEWLTMWERLLFALGWTDAEKLEQKHRPWLQSAPCEAPLCEGSPIMFVNGERLLCWDHYCAEQRQ